MSKQKFQTAKQLIDEGRYTQARAILETIDHPKAAEWIARLDRIVRSQGTQELPVAPEKQGRRTRPQKSTPLRDAPRYEDEPEEEAQPRRKPRRATSEQRAAAARKRRTQSQPKVEDKPKRRSRRGLLFILTLLIIVVIVALVLVTQQDDEPAPAVADNPTAEMTEEVDTAEPTVEATEAVSTATTVPPTNTTAPTIQPTSTDAPIELQPTQQPIVTVAQDTIISVARAVNESELVSFVNGLNVQTGDDGQVIVNASLVVQAATEATANTLRQIAIEALGIADAETNFTLTGPDDVAAAFRWVDGDWQTNTIVTDETLRTLYSEYPEVSDIQALELIPQNFALTDLEYTVNAVITVPVNTDSRQLAESMLEATHNVLQTQAITLQLTFITTDGAGTASFTWVHPDGWQANP